MKPPPPTPPAPKPQAPKPQKRPDERGFRALLFLGAAVAIASGLIGVVAPEMLESILGVVVGKRTYGIARLFGGVMIAVGIGYVLAAIHPQRSRSLLVMLFATSAITALVTIASTARGELKGLQGTVLAIYNLAYCLLYFRVYPRVPDRPARPAQEPPSTSKNLAP